MTRIDAPTRLMEDSILARPFLPAPRTLDWAGWCLRLGALLALLAGLGAVFGLGLGHNEMRQFYGEDIPLAYRRAQSELHALYASMYFAVSALCLLNS
ncbi:MAG: hypothetical protein ACRC0L_07085 [Angustibacter sp.]